jgi:hypothetical protein
MKWICTALCGWLALCGPLMAQVVPPDQFGSNLLHYGYGRKWKVLGGEKFDIFYYGDNRQQAEVAMRYAVAGYEELKVFYEHEPATRMQIHVYPSPYQHPVQVDDEGLNAQRDFPVAIGSCFYTGSQLSFQGAVKAEVARLMMQDAFYGSGVYRGLQNRILLTLPDWFVTGISTYLGEGWTPQDEMYLRGMDYGRLTPLLLREERSKRALVLKKSLWRFVAETFGEKKIQEVVYMSRLSRSVDAGISAALGMNMRAFASRWELWCRQQYLDKRVDLPMRKKRIDGLGENQKIVAVKPSPQGRYLALVVRSFNRYHLVIRDLKLKTLVRTPISGRSQTGSQFDRQLPFPIGWHPKGQQLIVGLPSGRGQSLFLYKLNEAEIERFDAYPKVDWVQDVAISTKGKIVVSAQNGGRSNLFLLSRASKNGEANFSPLTNDYFDNLQPTWEEGEASFLFVSNRDTVINLKTTKPDFAAYFNRTDIYRYNIQTKRVERVTNTPSVNEYSPQVTDSGIVCLTDQTGIPNIIRLIDNSSRQYLTDYTPGLEQMQFYKKDLLLISPVNGSLRVYLDDSMNWNLGQVPLNSLLGDEMQKSFRTWYQQRLKLRNPPPPPKKPTAAPEPEPELEPEPEPEPVQTPTKQRFYVFDEESPEMAPQAPKKRKKLSRTRFTAENNPQLPPEVPIFDINSVKVKTVTDAKPSLLLRRVSADFLNFTPLYGYTIKTNFRIEDPFRYHLLNLGWNQMLELRSFDINAQYLFRQWRVQFGGGFNLNWRFVDQPNNPLTYNSATANIRAAFPIDRYQRIEGDLKFIHINRTDLNQNDAVSLDGKSDLVGASFGYVFDNTRSIQNFTTSGIRAHAHINTQYSPKSGQFKYSYLQADFRAYVPLIRGTVLALRLSTGFGLDAFKPTFMLGGLDNWINSNIDNRAQLPATQRVEDLYFTQLITPMHGFNYNARNGSNYGLLNAEFRLPILKLFSRNLTSKRLYHIQFVAFYDIGTTWRQGNPFSQRNPVEVTTINSPPFLITVQSLRSPFLQAFGTGLRASIFGVYIKSEVSWGIEDGAIRQPQFTFTLGREF